MSTPLRWWMVPFGSLLGLAFLAGLFVRGLYPPVRAAEPADALTELNQASRAAYAQARRETLARLGPIIIVEGDDVVLLHNGKRSSQRFIPAIYDTLKTIDHVPLAIYAFLAPLDDGDIPEQRLMEMRGYRDRLPAALRALAGRGLTDSQLDRQKRILDGARDFLDGILGRKKMTKEGLMAFARKTAPLLLENAADAARVEVDGLHRQVMAWRAELSADEWKALRVIVVGSALPRKRNRSVQYFARLLNEPGEGARITYAEALWDETKALNLLGTRVFDTGIGTAFFDDPQRMHQDLLSDATEAYLKKLSFDP